MNPKLSPSMMCANLLELPQVLSTFEAEKIEYLHMDVMDGRFVPNYMLGTDAIRQMRKSSIPLDVHLMIERPEEKLDWFDFQPGEHVSLHYEGTCHIQKCLDHLAKKGVKPVIAINPGTPIQVLEEIVDYIAGVLVLHVNPGFAGQKIVPHTIEKAARIRKYLDDLGHPEVYIESDGNITCENAAKLYKNGSDIFVAGTSSIFREGDIDELIMNLRKAIGW